MNYQGSNRLAQIVNTISEEKKQGQTKQFKPPSTWATKFPLRSNRKDYYRFQYSSENRKRLLKKLGLPRYDRWNVKYPYDTPNNPYFAEESHETLGIGRICEPQRGST